MRTRQAGGRYAEIPVSRPGKQVAGQTYRWASRQKNRERQAEKQAGGQEDTWTVQMAAWAKGFGHLPQGL